MRVNTAELQSVVLHDRVAADAFLRVLSYREAPLFENPRRIQLLRDVLGPWLRSCAMPKIWVSEASCAEDVFTFAILLAELGVYDRTLIFATGPHEELLHEAREGTFALDNYQRYEQNYLQAGGQRKLSDYVTRTRKSAVFSAQLRNNVIWSQYSLATDTTFNEFQLIVCRRALSEFAQTLRRRTLKLFNDSLSPFGLLCLDHLDDAPGMGIGGTQLALNYKLISPAEDGVFRRIA
jgi:chemotaxis protein methyltransferase CheR